MHLDLSSCIAFLIKTHKFEGNLCFLPQSHPRAAHHVNKLTLTLKGVNILYPPPGFTVVDKIIYMNPATVTQTFVLVGSLLLEGLLLHISPTYRLHFSEFTFLRSIFIPSLLLRILMRGRQTYAYHVTVTIHVFFRKELFPLRDYFQFRSRKNCYYWDDGWDEVFLHSLSETLRICRRFHSAISGLGGQGVGSLHHATLIPPNFTATCTISGNC